MNAILFSEPETVVREFMDAICSINIEKYMAMWSDDGVMEFPFLPDPGARMAKGRAEIQRSIAGLEEFESFSFDNVVMRPLRDDEGTFVIEMTGQSVLKSGRRMDNRYCTIVNVTDGKITLWREYFDPSVYATAHG